MMFDQILAYLEPNAKYSFATEIKNDELSRLPGDEDFVDRSPQKPIFDDYDSIVWADAIIKQPTLAACQAAWLVLQDVKANEEIDEKRREEYLSYGEQFDMQYRDAINGTTEWVDHIAQVKADNPKLTN